MILWDFVDLPEFISQRHDSTIKKAEKVEFLANVLEQPGSGLWIYTDNVV